MSQAPAAEPTTPRRSTRVGLARGLLYPFRGARFVYIEHPSLAKLWLPPIVITFAALVVVTWAALDWHATLLQALWSVPSGDGWWAGAGRWLHRIVGWLVALALVVVGALLVSLLSNVVAAPFNDALSEAVERLQTGGGGPPPFSFARLLGDLGRTVGLELLKLGLYASVMTPLFLFGLLVPGVGPAVSMGLGFFLTAGFFSIDYVDWPASRRSMSIGARLRFARQHAGSMLGLGAGVWALLYVPLLNLFFMPAAVAGGTLMFLDLYGDNPETVGEPSHSSVR